MMVEALIGLKSFTRITDEAIRLFHALDAFNGKFSHAEQVVGTFREGVISHGSSKVKSSTNQILALIKVVPE